MNNRFINPEWVVSGAAKTGDATPPAPMLFIGVGVGNYFGG
jgi:hypothetical protein